MHQKIALRNVRFNWLDVLKPKQYEPGDPRRYKAEVLIEPDSEADKALNDALLSAAEDKWPGKSAGMLKIATSNKKVCRKLGNDMPPNKKTMETPEYYLEQIVLSAGRVHERDGAPRVFCKRLSTGKLVEVNEDTTFDDDLVKPVRGNFGDVLVSLWGWEHKGSPQMNCTLDAIIFSKEGDPLGGDYGAKDEDITSAFGAEIESSDAF